MAASEYVKWIKVANDLGLGGDELKMFAKEGKIKPNLGKPKQTRLRGKPVKWN